MRRLAYRLVGTVDAMEDAPQDAYLRALIDTTLASGVHPLFLVEEDYRLALLDAEAAFVDDFIARITHPKTGWAPLWAQFHRDATNERNAP